MKRAAYKVDVQILSRLPMHDYRDLASWLNLHFKMLPSMTPTRWNMIEPINRPFGEDTDWEEEMRLLFDPTLWPSFYWRRHKKTQSRGSFSRAIDNRTGQLLPTHSNESITSILSQTNMDELISYVKTSSVQFKADIAFIDVWNKNYYETVIKEIRVFQASEFFEDIYLTTHDLRHWLDDIYWGTVFGDAYVRLFGMDKILSAPVYKVEQLSDDTVYLQLTENITDSYEKFEEFQKIRQAVKNHLDPMAFYQKDKAYYPWGQGVFPDHELAKKTAGSVFHVPKFHLLSDSVLDWSKI
ncbi:hypothetical protein [Psychrobacter sp. FDAARGOS_221]|uniref:hypothetical protein n=1 Tax=Psychrobacter sp. FDAARGOS_221 TaxID=1975705 RepID=UPI000C9FFBE5|nr:hypothetical protein [Psychrobacter sp. FDAARGOS_221]PNK59550.1 hypothetical protein A6J60_000725 [Psychrobacter sp. FDAARGOS_221]